MLANVAFGSIAAIRQDTHRLLARFHSGLDAPFLSHRTLLETPEDAEPYAVELLNSEFNILLHDRAIGPRFAGKHAIRALLSELAADGHELRLMRQKNSESNPRTLSVDQVMHLVERGPAGLRTETGQQVKQNQLDQLHHRVDLLLSVDLQAGRAAHREFARLSSRARERALVPASYRAKLDLGSVVLLDSDYLLCIQPRCDAIRLGGSTQFIFAAFQTGTSSFDLIVKDQDGNDVLLSLNDKINEARLYAFEPDPDTRTVLSSSEGTFKDDGDRMFTWICDLRDSIARRFVQRITTRLSRIALAEFEWQRRHAKG